MADVEFTFAGNASSLQKAFADIKAELASTRSAVSSLTSQFANVYFTVQGAVAAIKTAFAAVSNIPAQAARIEDLSTIFSSLMGDTGQAAALMKDLWRDAANGAVSLEDMAAAAKPLATVFGDNKSIRDWTRRFADIAAGSGVAADSLAKVYARVLTLGKVDSRSIDSLAKQGIPIYQELAAVMGTSAAQVQQLGKAGQVSADQYTAALRRMTDEGGRYFQQSSLLSNTAKGSWDTMVENLNRVSAAIGQPINEAVTPVLQQIAASLEAAMPEVEAFVRSFVEGVSDAASAVSPIVSGIGSLVSSLGGMKTVVASVAAGLLMFSGNARAAAASTVSLRAQVGGLVTRMQGLSLASFGNAFKAALAGIRGIFASTLAGMRTAWSVAWSTMAAVTRAAMVAVKTALVSTGIGLIIVGIGEALGALYSWFTGNAEAAKEAAAATREFERSLASMEKQASRVKTQEQYEDFMEALEERIEVLRGQRDDALAEGEEKRAELLADQLSTLEGMQEKYADMLPAQVEAAQAAEREAEALRQQAEEAEELAQRLEEARKKMEDLVARQKEHEKEAFFSGLHDRQMEIEYRLKDVGHTSLEALGRELEAMEKRRGLLKEEDVARYEKLAAVYNKIVELKKKDAEETAKLAKEEQKQQEEASRKAQEIADARQEYALKVKILQAEIAGNEKKLQQLKMQQRIVQLTAEYQRQGIADAEAAARRMAALELRAEAARLKADSIAQDSGRGRDSGTRISSSLASVGGGGRSILIGGPLVAEGKKHTRLLEAIRAATSKPPTVQVSGNVDAVIGR
ncbi:MAG: tape measure protein [Akkermansia sp.]|nr:tape measure protein [Akkermansia sp.]